jgi:hypothetical protein
MITLYDIMKDLTYGEFQHLNIGNLMPDTHQSEPDPRAYEQFVYQVNKALTAIHARFPLRWDEVELQLNEEVTDYFLREEYRQSDGTAPVLYIVDTVAEPFVNNVLKVEEVYDEDGDEIPLNDVDEDLSVFTPYADMVQVPWPNDYNTISVQYRADHPKIEWAYGIDPETVNLEIQPHFIEPVLFYVAARIMAPLPDGGTQFWQKYQNRINFINDQGLYPQAQISSAKFDNRGFC